MNIHQLRDFVVAVLDLQRAMRCSMDEARATAAQMLQVESPALADFNLALRAPIRRRGRGRVKDGALTKSEAVAAVATYFESVGAGREQAIKESKRWLGVSLSRRVAKIAVEQFRANTAPDQFKPQALFAYATFGRSAIALPDSMQKVRKKRRPSVCDLG